jgi:flavin-dependent dehydrogenase
VLTLSPYRYALTHRYPFAQRLLAEAARAGARLLDERTIERPIVEDGRVRGVIANGEPLRADLVIDATGAARLLARQLGDPELQSQGADTVACYREQRLAEGPPAGQLDVVLGAHGYTWITADNHGVIDIGTGALTRSGRAPRAILEAVVRDRRDLAGAVRFRGAGAIPLGLPPRSLVTDGLMLVGDAGFQVLPTSGTGVGGSLIGAHLAAEAALAAFSHGAPDRAGLWRYNVAFFRERGAPMAALEAIRRELQGLTEPELSWLLARGLLPDGTMAAGVHGQWQPPDPPALWRALGKGWPRLGLLLGLGIRLQLASALASHYLAFPETPDPLRLAAWQRSHRLLTGPLQAG